MEFFLFGEVFHGFSYIHQFREDMHHMGSLQLFRMADPIQVTTTVRVPGEAIRFKAVRAGGAGGQNVNKVSSKVELRIDPAAIEGLPDGAL